MKQKIKRGIGLLLFFGVAAILVYATFWFWGENQSLQLKIDQLQGKIDQSVTVTSSNVEDDPQEGADPKEGAFVLSDVERCRKDTEILAVAYYDSSLSVKQKIDQTKELLNQAVLTQVSEEWEQSSVSTEESVLDFKSESHLEQMKSYYNVLSADLLSVFVSGTLQTNVSYTLDLEGKKTPVNNNTTSAVFFGATLQNTADGWKIVKIDRNLVAQEVSGRAPSNA